MSEGNLCPPRRFCISTNRNIRSFMIVYSISFKFAEIFCSCILKYQQNFNKVSAKVQMHSFDDVICKPRISIGDTAKGGLTIFGGPFTVIPCAHLKH